MNRLAHETSPYLRQHRDNPVDWYPWGDEAWDEARDSDRPVMVSIGYSACHWCHVMAHESFEDPAVAELLNEGFVSIKVDREERPDVDSVYMEAVQAMTGAGGWPMTVFCAPDRRPFFAGTYFPSDPRRGRPTFSELLEAIKEAWNGRRQDVLAQASSLTRALESRLSLATGASPEGSVEAGISGMAESLRGDAERAGAIVRNAVDRVEEMHDVEHGGFGDAPKFPQAPLLELLVRAKVGGIGEDPLGAVERSLAAMAAGGIYDHMGGGFARYSVDRAWQVPHFEKMLYDQASLLRLYLHAWQLTGDDRWLQVVEETATYVLRDLRQEGGGIHSAEDADSEGEEGRFYLWTEAEFRDLLGDGWQEAASWYGVTPDGNFEGRSILHRPPGAPLRRPEGIEQARSRLEQARSTRVRPGRDDKILTEWNAMWCSALAEAAAATGHEDWASAASETAHMLLSELRRPDGRWMRSWQGGRAAHLAYAADYAWLLDAFTRMAELEGRSSWLDEAERLAGDLFALFADDGGTVLYTTGRDAEKLIVRPRDVYDGVIPAATSVAAVALCRLSGLTGHEIYADRAASLVSGCMTLLERAPSAVPHLCWAVEILGMGSVEVVVAGERPDLLAQARRELLPRAAIAWGERRRSPIWEGREDGAAYVCRGSVCLAPCATPEQLRTALRMTAGAPR